MYINEYIHLSVINIKKMIKIIIFIIVYFQCIKCCDILNYNHLITNKTYDYIKLNSINWNNQSVYKQANEDYYIYKLNSFDDYYCHSYKTNNYSDNCKLRFNYKEIYINDGTVVQRLKFNTTWTYVYDQNIRCKFQSHEYLLDNF